MKTAIFFLIILLAAPLSASELDDRIVDAARNSHEFQTTLKKDQIEIYSIEGQVTLKGKVFDPAHKAAAENAVTRLPGVKSVDNQLFIESRPGNDGWLAVKVKSALLYHMSVKTFSVKVSANNGVVTLQGKVPSEEEKALASRYAQAVSGVTEVRNQLAVGDTAASPGNPEDQGSFFKDTAITIKAKTALATNKSTSALNTHIETSSGVVTATGTAKSAEEKETVTRILQDIEGVRLVVNNMTVQTSP